MTLLPSDPGRMNVIESLSLAIDRCKRLLFQPFDIFTWLRFGFIIFLASLATGGHGGGNSGGYGNRSGATFPETIEQAREWVLANLTLVVLIGGIIVLTVMALMLVLLWLGSRGQMMLIRAVAMGDPYIGRNWSAVRRQGNSVWRFRIILMIVGAAVFIPLVIAAILLIFGLAESGEQAFLPFLMALLPLITIGVVAGLPFWMIHLLLTTFVMPLMYKDDVLCIEGWRRFRVMSNGNLGPILLLFVIRFAYFIGFGIVAFFVGCITCCLGFIPYIHDTLLAPFYVFDRAYSLYAIESLGPTYRIFLQGSPTLP